MLAALYVRKSEKLAASDPAAALSVLKESLMLDAGQPKALQLLNQLQPGGQRSIPRKPMRDVSP